MKAMVLAAGFGSRLGEMSKTTPKCLVEVAGKSMLEHVVDRLRLAGVTEIVINLHHLADQVRTFVIERGNFGLKVHFTEESEILGTGGGLKNARKFFDAVPAFYVHNADIYSEIDLRALADAHRHTGAIATLATMSRPTSRPLVFGMSGNLVGWESKENSRGELLPYEGPLVRYAFCGVQVVSSAIFKYMEPLSGAFSTIRTYLEAARAGERVRAYDCGSAYWMDMGSPEKLAELRRHLSKATH